MVTLIRDPEIPADELELRDVVRLRIDHDHDYNRYHQPDKSKVSRIGSLRASVESKKARHIPLDFRHQRPASIYISEVLSVADIESSAYHAVLTRTPRP